MVNQTRLIAGVDALIDVHQRTGIDLGEWEPVLELVREVYPDFEPIPEIERTFSEEAHKTVFGPDSVSLYKTPVGRATFKGAAQFPLSVRHEKELPHD